MEAAFLVLIGGALFAQSWNHLGLFAEGRGMGIVVGGLGLVALVALVMDPMLIQGKTLAPAEALANLTIMKGLILLWSVFIVAMAAQSFLDLEERAVGFFAGFVAIVSVIALVYFVVEMTNGYGGDGPWLTMGAATLILAMTSGIVFFHQAIPFQAIRLVAGWFLLIGGSALGMFGLLIATTIVKL
jgi:hypothetical protein